MRIIPSTVAHNDLGQKIVFIVPNRIKNKIWKHVTRDDNRFKNARLPYAGNHFDVRNNSRHHRPVGRRSYNDRNLDNYRPSNSRHQNINNSTTHNYYHEKNKQKPCPWEKNI